MTQDLAASPARYEFPPPQDESVAFGLSAVQLGVIVSSLLVVITTSRAGVPLWLLALVATPVIGFGAARWKGERLPTLAARWVGWALRPRKSKRPPVTATASLPASDGSPTSSGVQPVRVEPPGWAKGVELVEAPYGEQGQTVGVWRDGDALATVLAVRAPATALRDLDEQSSFLAGWGDLLASVGAEGSPVQRVAWVARTSPDQGADAAGWLRDHGDSTVRLAQPSIWRSYVEVGETAGQAAAARELLLVVRVQPDRARHRLRGLRGEARRAGEVQLAISETERIGGRLVELGCQLDGLYTPEAVAAVVRTTCDPAGRADLARWDAATGDGHQGGVSPVSGMWPTSWEEAADHVRADSGWHRLAWVEEWPTVPVFATWMHPLLLRSTVTRTVAMVMEPVATHSAARSARRARAAAVSEAEVRARHGFVSDARSERSFAAAEQREQELIDGHRDMTFAAYVCVTARTLGELEESWATTVYEAGQSRLRLRALHGEHWPAVQAVLPLGRLF